MIAVRVTERSALSRGRFARLCGALRPAADAGRSACPQRIRYRLPGGGFIPWLFVEDGKLIEFDIAGSSIVINDPEWVIMPRFRASGSPYLYEEYVGRMIADGRLVSLLDKSVSPVTEGFFG